MIRHNIFSFTAGKNISEHYDGANGTTTKYTYDSIGRFVNSRSTNGFETFQNYDTKNRINMIYYKRGGITQNYTFSYNSRDLISSIFLPTNRSISMQYDGLNRLTYKYISTTYPLTTSYTYQSGVNGSTSTQVQQMNTPNGNYSYTYDNNGNILTITKSGSLQVSYFYDNLNQLVRENNVTEDKTVIYSYDGYGNLQNKKTYDYTTASDLTEMTYTIISYGYGDTNWKDKMTSYAGQTITYDAIGNPLT